MQSIMVYPDYIACEIAPEYEDIDEPILYNDFTQSTTTLLIDNEEDD